MSLLLRLKCLHFIIRLSYCLITFLHFQMIVNHLLSHVSIVAGVIAIVICAKYGLYKCLSHQIDYLEHSCNYTINFHENHSLAMLELAFLCAATLMAVLVVIVTAWCLRILRHRQCCSLKCVCCCYRKGGEGGSCCGRGDEKGLPVPAEEMQTLNGGHVTHERVS